MDFPKAFNSVPHKRLLLKLESLGFLTKRYQRVAINGSFSEWTPVTTGVPQNSVFGPLLFLLYVNDLAEVPRRTSVQIFADNVLLYFTDNSVADCRLLQDDLQCIIS